MHSIKHKQLSDGVKTVFKRLPWDGTCPVVRGEVNPCTLRIYQSAENSISLQITSPSWPIAFNTTMLVALACCIGTDNLEFCARSTFASVSFEVVATFDEPVNLEVSCGT